MTSEICVQSSGKYRRLSCFYIGSTVIFAWFASIILDDETDINVNGVPANLGYGSFSNSLYTSFVATTGATIPDFMAPSFAYSRYAVLLFIPFLFLTIIVFMPVIIAVVYQNYQSQMKKIVEEYVVNRVRGSRVVFELLSEDNQVSLDRFQELEKLCNQSSETYYLHPELVPIIFDG